MAAAKYQHTVQLPADMEETWKAYQAQRQEPESFNAFVIRLIRQEMELLCVTTTRI
jgi:hypothetical protein